MLTETIQTISITLLWMKPIVSDIIFYCETDLYLQTSTVDKIVYSDKDYKKSGINVGDSARYVSRPH